MTQVTETTPGHPLTDTAPVEEAFAGRSRRATWLRRHSRSVWGLAGIVLVLALWQIVASAGWVDKSVSSDPWLIAQALVRLFGGDELTSALGSTSGLVGFSLGLSIVVGIPIGLVLGAYRPLHDMAEPIISVLNSVPFILFIPIIIFWFGLGDTSRALLVIWAAILPIIVNITVGMRNLDRDYIRVAKAFCCSQRRFYYSVAIPATLPYLLAGIRLALGRALVGAVAAEFFLSGSGLGAFVQVQTSNFNMTDAMAAIALIAALSVLLTQALGLLESRFTHWAGSND
jgi:ABC-type nitrate/sulfonate/bicarbonate transport system permease component